MAHLGFALRALSSISSVPGLRRSPQGTASGGNGQAIQHRPRPCLVLHDGQATTTAPSGCAVPARPATTSSPMAPGARAARPLRVILRQQEDGACRLVISGRMADVCAELDRLALH